MKLEKIWEKMNKYLEEHPDVYDIDQEEDSEVWDGWNELQDKIFSDNQTFFQWNYDEYDGSIDVAEAMDTVLEFIKANKYTITDYVIHVGNDDHLYVLVEYK